MGRQLGRQTQRARRGRRNTIGDTVAHVVPKHAATRGFLQQGYIAITPATPTEGVLTREAEVIIAVTCKYCGQWDAVQRCDTGRAVAGSIISAAVNTIRILGVYNVTGLWMQTANDASALAVEMGVVNFISNQVATADQHGWSTIIGGDMNSIEDLALDRWGPPTSGIRPTCLAKRLQNIGFRDTFRERHPTLRTMT